MRFPHFSAGAAARAPALLGFDRDPPRKKGPLSLFLPVIAIFAYWCRHYRVPQVIGIAVGVVVELMALAKRPSKGPGPPFRDDQLDAAFRELIDQIPEAALFDERVRAGLREAGAEVELLAASRQPDRRQVNAAFEKLFRRFQKAVPPSIFADGSGGDLDSEKLRELAWRGWLAWVWLITEPPNSIAARLCQSSPRVGLFIHHMMDMENWYSGGRSFYNVVPVQLSLVRDLLVHSDGRLIPCVAFDPKRGKELASVKAGYALGGVGVKFYPANGFRPAGNKKRKIEDAVNALFRWCVDEGVPVFSHCTPSGFESSIGVSGCNADPEHWRTVLETHPKLRLCFGHAGGDEGWLGATERTRCETGKTFAQIVIELCSNRDRQVYCEIGYLTPLLESAEKRDAFKAKLREWTRNNEVLRQRICFGTDWHMPGMVVRRTPSEYFDLFDSIFQDAELRGWRDAFFSTNAAAFLDLPRYADRMTDVLSAEAVAFLRSLAP